MADTALLNTVEVTEKYLARLDGECQSFMSDYLRYKRDPEQFYRVKSTVAEILDIAMDLKSLNSDWEW